MKISPFENYPLYGSERVNIILLSSEHGWPKTFKTGYFVNVSYSNRPSGGGGGGGGSEAKEKHTACSLTCYIVRNGTASAL